VKRCIIGSHLFVYSEAIAQVFQGRVLRFQPYAQGAGGFRSGQFPFLLRQDFGDFPEGKYVDFHVSGS